jgi:hypothetical protein
VNIDQKTDMVFNEFENEMDLLGVVGIADTISSETVTMVKDF